MDKVRFKEIVKSFSGKRIVVVGDVMIDHYVHGIVERLNPEAPVPILNARNETEQTGGAGNVAKNCASLGARATLIGVVGDDLGASRIADLATYEHYTARCIRDMSRPTTRKVRYIAGSQQLLRVDFEKIDNASPEVEEELTVAIQEAAKDAQAIVVSDYAKGVITERIASVLMEVRRAHNIPIVADIKPSHAFLFEHADIISPNRKEAHEMLGLNMHERGGLSARDLADKLHDKYDADVYLTLSADGMYVRANDGTDRHFPQEHVVQVYDTSGAGDTAVTVLLLSRLAGATHEEAVKLANASGAIVVQKIGAVGVSQKELIDMVSHKHG